MTVLGPGPVPAGTFDRGHRSRRAFAGGATSLAGAVATAGGLAVGWPHLHVDHRIVPTVGGLLVAAGGLGLVVAGGRVSVRAVRGWRRWAEVVAVAALAAVLCWPVAVGVYASTSPRRALGSSPAAVGLAYEDVTFPATDGVELAGWYVPSTNGAAVALLHGASSTRSDVLRPAAVLARHGYGVLLVDARGHGRSRGRTMELGWYGDRDVGGAVAYLAGRPDVDPDRIGAVGLSMGGEEAVGALAAVPRLRAVVGEGVTGRVAADQAWLSDRFGLRGWLTEQVHHLTEVVADVLSPASPPASLRRSIATARRPVLLIAAGAVPDEQDAADFLRSGSPGTVQVWEVPGAGHTDGLRARPREWERRVVAFLDRALAAR